MAYSTAQAHCRPSDEYDLAATWSVISGTANASFPVTNLALRDPAVSVFKATGTSVTVRATFPAPVVIEAIAIVNHNWAGAASVVATSGTGLNQAITIPANRGRQHIAPILYLPGTSATLAHRTSSTFDIAVTTGVLGPIAVGRIMLLGTVRDLRWNWGIKITPRHLVVARPTFGATLLQYDKRILVHDCDGTVDLQTEEAAMRFLEEESEGEVFPWVLWPNTSVAEIYYVQYKPGTFGWQWNAPGFTNMPIQALQVSNGPPLFP